MTEDKFKALCESMSLTELGKNLRTGLAVLYDKLLQR